MSQISSTKMIFSNNDQQSITLLYDNKIQIINQNWNNVIDVCGNNSAISDIAILNGREINEYLLSVNTNNLFSLWKLSDTFREDSLEPIINWKEINTEAISSSMTTDITNENTKIKLFSQQDKSIIVCYYKNNYPSIIISRFILSIDTISEGEGEGEDEDEDEGEGEGYDDDGYGGGGDGIHGDSGSGSGNEVTVQRLVSHNLDISSNRLIIEPNVGAKINVNHSVIDIQHDQKHIYILGSVSSQSQSEVTGYVIRVNFDGTIDNQWKQSYDQMKISHINSVNQLPIITTKFTSMFVNNQNEEIYLGGSVFGKWTTWRIKNNECQMYTLPYVGTIQNILPLYASRESDTSSDWSTEWKTPVIKYYSFIGHRTQNEKITDLLDTTNTTFRGYLDIRDFSQNLVTTRYLPYDQYKAGYQYWLQPEILKAIRQDSGHYMYFGHNQSDSDTSGCYLTRFTSDLVSTNQNINSASIDINGKPYSLESYADAQKIDQTISQIHQYDDKKWYKSIPYGQKHIVFGHDMNGNDISGFTGFVIQDYTVEPFDAQHLIKNTITENNSNSLSIPTKDELNRLKSYIYNTDTHKNHKYVYFSGNKIIQLDIGFLHKGQSRFY